MSLYFTLRAYYQKRHPAEAPSSVAILTMGAMSSFVAQTCAYPLQLARTRLQAKNTEYHGTLDIFKKVIKQEGVFGLWRGLTPNFMKAIPAVAISYLCYEKVMSFKWKRPLVFEEPAQK